MLKSLSASALLALLLTGTALADSCPAGCPSLPTNTSNNGTSSTTNNVQGVASPEGVNVNQQNNFTTQGQVQYGGGISCQDNSITPYVGVANSNAGGFQYGTVSAGVAATILIGPNHAACQQLAQIVIAQHANDTLWGNVHQCVLLAQANVDLTSPALHGACIGVVIAPPQPVVVQTPPVVITRPAPIAAAAPARSCDPVALDLDTFMLHGMRKSLRTLHPDPRMAPLEARIIDHDCGTWATINKALDG